MLSNLLAYLRALPRIEPARLAVLVLDVIAAVAALVAVFGLDVDVEAVAAAVIPVVATVHTAIELVRRVVWSPESVAKLLDLVGDDAE